MHMHHFVSLHRILQAIWQWEACTGFPQTGPRSILSSPVPTLILLCLHHTFPLFLEKSFCYWGDVLSGSHPTPPNIVPKQIPYCPWEEVQEFLRGISSTSVCGKCVEVDPCLLRSFWSRSAIDTSWSLSFLRERERERESVCWGCHNK